MTLIYFILVLTITVMVHEFGHFICAKKNGVYVYEFSIGMGPKLISKKKGETDYFKCWNNNDIKSIVTKEQFNSVKYEI